MAKGWTYDKFRSKPYRAQISINGEHVTIGNFSTPEEARLAYLIKRDENPALPRSGGGRHAGFTIPRKLCDLCKKEVATNRFNAHLVACERRQSITPRWTEQQKEELMNLYSNTYMNIKDIAAKIGKSYHASSKMIRHITREKKARMGGQ